MRGARRKRASPTRCKPSTPSRSTYSRSEGAVAECGERMNNRERMLHQYSVSVERLVSRDSIDLISPGMDDGCSVETITDGSV
jgi:hypothetical protein